MREIFLKSIKVSDFSVRRCDHCGDFSLSATLPGRTPLTARATVSSSSTISSSNLDIFLGTEKENDYERLLFQHTFKQETGTIMEKRHITILYYVLQYRNVFYILHSTALNTMIYHTYATE